MKIYDVSRLPSSIALGWDGENNWRPIAFDCSALLAGHSDGVVTLWLLPKGETQAFPVALERDGDTVVWTPLSEEMTAEHGQLQIVVQDGTDVGKSKVIDYTVHDSLAGGADHPAETPSWATQVVADVTEQADRAEEAAESIGESIGEQLPGAIAEYLEEHPVTVTETDPTVPAWAKAAQKPSYTAQEVGALPDSYTPPVQSVNGKTGVVELDAEDVGALPDSTVIPAAVTEQTVAGWGFTKNTGTYSKPSGGIPASDLAAGVIPTVPQMADDYVLEGMDDWTAGKTVDAATLKNAMNVISQGIGSKANASDIPTKTSDLTNDSGYQTATQVQTAIAPLQPKAITDTGNYYTTDTVEGALQEIGAELAGINTLIGTGVIS